jgi:hypothetical protein
MTEAGRRGGIGMRSIRWARIGDILLALLVGIGAIVWAVDAANRTETRLEARAERSAR